MATLVGKFRKIFTQPKKQKIPAFIECGVNPTKYWDVLESIGEGSFGAVKKATNKGDPSLVAAYKCTEIQEGEEVEDLAIEVQILLECKHPNIVKLLAAYYHDNCLSVMLEYCSGGSVEGIMLDMGKPLTSHQIAPITRQIVDGLIFLHSRRVIHRDLKAGNVLLTIDGVAKLADFGVSTILTTSEEGSTGFIGTPHWMSPEVVRCETSTSIPYNYKADIWSLGITVVEMVQMEPPYHDMSAERVRLKILKNPDPPPLDRPNSINSELRDFIYRCLVINPEERASASNLLAHPYITRATDLKHVKILVLEHLSEYNEEAIFEADSSHETMSSDGESIWSKNDENLNGDEYERLHSDKEQTPTVEVIPTSIKKRVAPAPPRAASADMQSTKSVISNDSISIHNNRDSTSIDDKHSRHLSPSGQEALKLLNDLDFALNQHDDLGTTSKDLDISPGSAGNRSSQNSPLHQKVFDSHSTKSLSPDRNHRSDRHESASSAKSVPPTSQNGSKSRRESVPTPSHTIGEIAKQAYASRNSSLKGHPPSNSVSTSSQGRPASCHVMQTSNQAIEPVRLRVNDDLDETTSTDITDISDKASPVSRPRIPSYSSDGSHSRNSVVADIPQGLVRQKREIAQKEQLADHARDDAERIKEQRRKEDAIIFGEKNKHVSDLAASFTSKAAAEAPKEKAALRQEVLRKMEQLEQRPLSIPTQSPVSSKPPRPISNPEKIQVTQPIDYFDEDVINLSKKLSEPEEPPPEPPIDYDATPKAVEPTQRPPMPPDTTPKIWSQRGHHLQKHVSVNGKENTDPKPKESLVRRTPSRQTATKKTRTFTVDGVQMTSTTLLSLETKQLYESRKAQEREFLRMQREEARQTAALEKKAAAMQDQQEKVFATEKLNIEKTYQSDLDLIAKTQKKKIEELERAQEDEIKTLSKTLKADQERQLRGFKEQVAQENKLLKQEADTLPKHLRKDFYRDRKEQLDNIHNSQHLAIVEKLDRSMRMTLDNARGRFREEMSKLEAQFLEHNQQLKQQQMSSLWEMEDNHLRRRFELNQELLKEQFQVTRSAMLARHRNDMDALLRQQDAEQEAHSVEVMNLKRQRKHEINKESKTRLQMFKESLPIKYPNEKSRWSEMNSRFAAEEKERVQKLLEELDSRLKGRVDEMHKRHQANINETKKVHAEYCQMLIEAEQKLLDNYEQQFDDSMKKSRVLRSSQKMELEKQFFEEKSKLDRFFGIAPGHH